MTQTAPRISMRCFQHALLLALLVAAGDTLAQDLPNPLQGQRLLPRTVAQRVVSTSVYLERVFEIDSKQSTYTASWFVVMDWTDDSAYSQVYKDSATTYGASEDPQHCLKPCDGMAVAEAGCCHGLWLPTFDMPNLISQAQDQIPRYRITATPDGRVRWSVRIVGTWYSPYDFRAFPFEHQHLMFQIQVADSLASRVAVKLNHFTKLNATAHTKGADLVGWDVIAVHGDAYDSRQCQAEYHANVTAFGLLQPSDPSLALPVPQAAPGGTNSTTSGSGTLTLYPTLITTQSRLYVNGSVGKFKKPTGCGTFKDTFPEFDSLYGPMVIVVSVMVRRAVTYYVLGYLIPLLIIPLITLVIFAFPQNALAERMGVIVTMFLSLTAMQFVFDYPPSRYLNAMQQISLMVYALLLITSLESLLVAKLVGMAEETRTRRTAQMRYSHLMHTLKRTSTSGIPPGPQRRMVSKRIASGRFSRTSSSRTTSLALPTVFSGEDVPYDLSTVGSVSVKDEEIGAVPAAAADASGSTAGGGGARGGVRKTTSFLTKVPQQQQRQDERGSAGSGSVRVLRPSLKSSIKKQEGGGGAAVQASPPATASEGPMASPITGTNPVALTSGPVVTASSAELPVSSSAVIVESTPAAPPVGAISVKRVSAPGLPPLPPPPLPSQDSMQALLAAAQHTMPLSAPAPPVLPHAQPHMVSPFATVNAAAGGRCLGVPASPALSALHSMQSNSRSASEAGSTGGADGKGNGKGGKGSTASGNACCNPERCGPWCYTYLVTGPVEFYRSLKEDADFASYCARWVDRFFAVFCIVSFAICASLIVWLQTELGMHKMLLGQSMPGNM